MRKLIAFLLLLSFCSADLYAGHYLIIKSNGGPDGYGIRTERSGGSAGHIEYYLVCMEAGNKTGQAKILRGQTFTSSEGEVYEMHKVLREVENKLRAHIGDGHIRGSIGEEVYYEASREGGSDLITIYTGQDAISAKGFRDARH